MRTTSEPQSGKNSAFEVNPLFGSLSVARLARAMFPEKNELKSINDSAVERGRRESLSWLRAHPGRRIYVRAALPGECAADARPKYYDSDPSCIRHPGFAGLVVASCGLDWDGKRFFLSQAVYVVRADRVPAFSHDPGDPLARVIADMLDDHSTPQRRECFILHPEGFRLRCISIEGKPLPMPKTGGVH